MIKKILLICILLLAFAHPAVGHPQYVMQDVVIGAYLVDLSYNGDEDTAMVGETIVFINNGNENHTDDLCVAIPVNAEVMHVMKMDMGSAPSTQVLYERDGEILCWNTTIAPGAMAMYSITYAVPITESGGFVKNLDPAVMNYPIVSFKLNVSTDGSIKLADENGVAIKQDPAEDRDGGALYVWTEGMPFKEVHVNTSQPSNMDKWIVYGIIALLIISALLYPILHVRNNKMREKEMEAEKGGNKHPSRDRGDESDEEPVEGEWEEINNVVTEVTQTEKDLMRKKRAILAVLNKLEEDRDAGAVSDAECKRISSKYEKQAIEIMKQLDQM